MQSRYILLAVVVVVVFGLMWWQRSRTANSPNPTAPPQISLADLSEGERHVYDLLREVQGHAILTESFVRKAGDAEVSLTLDTNKTTVSSLNVNLSSLARKQKVDGLSDGAVKRGFVF